MRLIELSVISAIAAGLLLAVISYSQSAPRHLDPSNMAAELNGTAGSVTGNVRDIACPYRNRQ